MNFEDIGTINKLLKEQKTGVSIRKRTGADRLVLRATLPPKQNSGSIAWSQQEISTGLRDNPVGRIEAYRRALKLSIDLVTQQFEWSDWLRPRAGRKEKAGEIIAKFAADYQREAELNDRTRWRLTWEKDYRAPFEKLDLDRPLNPQAMTKIVESYGRATRPRQRHARAYTALCKYVGIEAVFDAGTYGRKQMKDIEIPSDQEIIEAYHRVPERWRWSYGVMACYGLRPSEVVEVIGFSGDLLILGDGKTGAREVLPFPESWFTAWHLWQASFPLPVAGRSSPTSPEVVKERMGLAMSKAIRKSAGFPPKVLRKAAAIRMMTEGVPDTVAGKNLGHDPATLREHYQGYIDAKGMRAVMRRFSSVAQPVGCF